MRNLLILIFFLLFDIQIFAQGTLSGDFMMNMNFFQRDSSIRASDNPLYDNYLNGNEAWLDLRYSYKGFTVFTRIDGFNNSNLYNPNQAMRGFGIGAWSVSKEINNDLTVTAGYIYDQIGSGLLFRSYEDRGLLIDNALVGFELKYKLQDNITLKGFTGQQKKLSIPDYIPNERYEPVIKGLNAEGDFTLGKAHLLPGIGVLNRTLDDKSMSSVVDGINAQPIDTRFVPTYNMYAFTAYNTLTVGKFSWYAEGAFKSHEAIAVNNLLIDKPGNSQFTTIGYAQKGLAINFSGKRTENFVMRTSPNEILLNGMLNWQPVIARIRPQRLIARYTPASQDVSEMAEGVDVLIAPNDNLNITTNYTHITTLDNIELYQEIYGEFNYQAEPWVVEAGCQILKYNRELYQVHPGAPMVNAVTPFADVTYKLTSKKSLRAEFQYMATQQDYGSWVFALLEFNIAPKWSISASDMYNIAPNTNEDNPNYEGPGITPAANHYYNIFTSYTKGPHRFTIAYVKQVDGINCTGGVCRYEPAFSGVKATITSSF